MDKKKIIGIAGLASLAIIFGVAYTVIPKIINDIKIRNKNYNPAYLKECKSVDINNSISNYSVSFTNTKEMIVAKVFTNEKANISINGYHDDKLLQTSIMQKEEGDYYFAFHPDYYNLNKIYISMNSSIHVSKIVIYYAK